MCVCVCVCVLVAIEQTNTFAPKPVPYSQRMLDMDLAHSTQRERVLYGPVDDELDMEDTDEDQIQLMTIITRVRNTQADTHTRMLEERQYSWSRAGMASVKRARGPTGH